MVQRLTEIINAAYAAGENGLWPPNTPRVFEYGVQEMVDREELLFAYRDGELAGLESACTRSTSAPPSSGCSAPRGWTAASAAS